jgi:hypothetical protein
MATGQKDNSVKHLAILATTLLLLVSVATSAEAASGGASSSTYSVSFVMTSAQCSNLPAGMTLTGSGSETSITTTTIDAQNVTTMVNSTHAHGTAADQAGNTYTFNYSNSFRASNTVAIPGVFSGSMTDAFSLAGNGPANLHNGFVSDFFTTDFSTWNFYNVTHANGDPISFPAGVAHCDPL